MKDWQYILKNLSLLSQMGIYIPGFIMGLGGSFMTAYKLYLAIMKTQKKKKNREHEKAFNRHV